MISINKIEHIKYSMICLFVRKLSHDYHIMFSLNYYTDFVNLGLFGEAHKNKHEQTKK